MQSVSALSVYLFLSNGRGRAIMRTILKLEYPITKPFTFRYFNLILVTLGVISALFVTLFNLPLYAYKDTTINSPEYNTTTKLWYEHMFPETGWFERSTICSSTTLHSNDCTSSPS